MNNAEMDAASTIADALVEKWHPARGRPAAGHHHIADNCVACAESAILAVLTLRGLGWQPADTSWRGRLAAVIRGK